MRHQIAARFEESRITFFLGVRGVNINPYLQLLLAPQGVSMVHAAGVERNGDVLLLPAFGGAGKTLAAGVLVQEHGYRFLGDDIVLLTREGQVLPFPRPLMLYGYHDVVYGDYLKKFRSAVIMQRSIGRLKRNVVVNLPLRSLIGGIARGAGVEGFARRVASTQEHLVGAEPEDVFGRERLSNGGRVKRVVMLQRSDGMAFRCTDTVATQVAQRMFAIIHLEWASEWPFVTAAAAHGLIDLGGYYAATRETITSGIGDADAQELIGPAQLPAKEYARSIASLM